MVLPSLSFETVCATERGGRNFKNAVRFLKRASAERPLIALLVHSAQRISRIVFLKVFALRKIAGAFRLRFNEWGAL